MIVRLLRTVRRGQKESGRIIWEDGELRVEGAQRPERLLDTIFNGPVPDDPDLIRSALLDMPRRWDGFYLRAEIVEEIAERDLSHGQVSPDDPGMNRYAWESAIATTWGDALRYKIGLAAVQNRSAMTYGLFDGPELVGVASMAIAPEEPPPRWALVAYPHIGYLEGNRAVYYMATKRPGYGEELLAQLRMAAGDNGIWLRSTWEAEGFQEAMGGIRVAEGSERFYWAGIREFDPVGSGLEPWHGAFADMPRELWEGGPGSGWFAPPKGTHRKGSQGGGLDPGTGEDVYQVGITSHRPGKDPRQLRLEMDEFVEDLQGVAEDVDVQLGTGGWEGGSEPTWVVRFRDGDDALAVLAATGKRHNQDAVLVMKYTTPGNGSPLVRLNFSRKLEEEAMRKIEAGLVENGIGGWTWARAARGTVLLAASVPQWGGQNTPHVAAMSGIQQDLLRAGYKTTSTTSWVETTVMERGEYDRWAG